MATNEINAKWEKLIENYSKRSKFESRTCHIYNKTSKAPPDEPDKLCPCKRMIRRHSLTESCLESEQQTHVTDSWKPPEEFQDGGKHSISVPVQVYGTLEPGGCRFLRIDQRLAMKTLFELMVENSEGQKPSLIISIYGGAKYFTMTERLEKEFIRGVIDAATMANAWILTAGISNGVSKLVGEGVSHYSLLHEYSRKVTCIGMTMWGTVNENTHIELKKASKNYPESLRERQIPDNVQENKETIEPNHTHCILFDSGRLNDYLSDSQRNLLVKEACKDVNYTCYAVTIIVEGGTGTLEVLENDVENSRPIVLIQGSGRLADVLSSLIEQTSNDDQNRDWDPSDEEIKLAFERFYPGLSVSQIEEQRKRIKKLFKQENRHLFHVFSLDRDKNVAETIFKAIFKATKEKMKIDPSKKNPDESLDIQTKRQKLEDKLVDLALEWDYFDGILPILQARQDEMMKKKRESKEDAMEYEHQNKRDKQLFVRSLEKNRPAFIKYFLMSGFDPLTILENASARTCQKFILGLYVNSYKEMNKSHRNRIASLFNISSLKSSRDLDKKLNEVVGSFIGPIYSSADDSYWNRIKIDLSNHVCTCCTSLEPFQDFNNLHDDHQIPGNNPTENLYSKHHMLRDLFLWSSFMDMPAIAKVLLLHIRPRICAALIASAIFKDYAESSQKVDLKNKFQAQSLEFETYAAKCVDKCYEYNEKRACELLLRQIPLFGNISCIQIAVSNESIKVLETSCFDQTLNEVWFDKLSLSNQHISAKVALIPALLTFGLTAPWIISYRKLNEDSLNNTKDDDLSRKGINYYVDENFSREGKCKNYWKRVKYFHESSTVKMSYHFISYIFLLLVFSYMMLYHLDGRDKFTTPHWTEIYVIITVSTMLCEEARQVYHDYKTISLERWGATGSAILTIMTNAFYILPYLLFYLGLGFRYGSYTDELLTTARIIWALDLELWYLRSLKFAVALKFLGPKLFMLKNMLRDLFAFVYMIFIAIAAYGVVSRSLILYNQVPFTGHGIFDGIFYGPYFLMYGDLSDKQLMDNIITNGTSSTGSIAEATATHVLLAFHMLFINILLLNLLIAVFADSIGKVQQNTEFYWRYQHHSLVREYFERLPLAYPPLILIPHVILLFLAIKEKFFSKCAKNQVTNAQNATQEKRLTRIFKMIPERDAQYEQWDSFENAATLSYARSIVEKKRNNDTAEKNDETDKGSEQISKIEKRLDELSKSLLLIMEATGHSRGKHRKAPSAASKSSPGRSDTAQPNQTTAPTGDAS